MFLPFFGVCLTHGVTGAKGGGISVGPFLVGVEGTLAGRVPARGFLRGSSVFSSVFCMALLACCSPYGTGLGGPRMYSVFSELGMFGCCVEV